MTNFWGFVFKQWEQKGKPSALTQHTSQKKKRNTVSDRNVEGKETFHRPTKLQLAGCQGSYYGWMVYHLV